MAETGGKNHEPNDWRIVLGDEIGIVEADYITNHNNGGCKNERQTET